ncbi:MAG TPA: hypothetical protein PK156_16675 [Polyangium sp.]|nr:hypothetical protein [Polyangium sp.]
MNTSSSSEQNDLASAKVERRVRMACILALVALALIVFSLLVPKPLPVIVAMSVAQGIGTLSLVLFLLVVRRDIWGVMGSKTMSAKNDSSDEPTSKS